MHRPDAQSAAAAHDAMRSDGTVPAQAVAEMIRDSWKRSLSYGLSESQRPHYDPLPPGRLADARDQNHILTRHARPVMETLYEQIVNTQSMIVLTDAHGLILHSLGDDDFLSRAEKVALRPGVCWSESSKGTNAIGTAIAEGAPTLVHGPEHFLTANHFLTCSAVPIADPHGKPIGILDVTGDCNSYHRHTLALVKMSGQLIENHLFEGAFPESVMVRFHSRPEFVGTLCQGMVAFAPDGGVVSANKSGLFQLGIGRSGLRSHTFSSLFGLPLSVLFDQARGHADELLPLTMHTGVRVFARVSLGTQVRRPPSAFFAGIVPGDTVRTKARQPDASAGATAARGVTLDRLKTGDSLVDAAITKVQRVIGRDIAILIQGETGTGKELVARAIHNDSPRQNGPFVAVNCASIPEGLIESELFGYEEGAFTGARKKGCTGKIQLADGGTLFLDEIGDMPLNLQARLLRVLQERVVTPLGSVKSYPVDVAIIGATHRKLKELIARGQFREDLYYRLNGLLINLPPLRARSDLPQVVERILRDELRAGPRARVAPEVIELFRRHRWPGNMRQMSNLLRTALAMAEDDSEIRSEHLPDDFAEDLEPAPAVAAPAEDTKPGGHSLESVEESAIRRALGRHKSNVSAAARELGISRNTIYRKMRRYGIPTP